MENSLYKQQIVEQQKKSQDEIRHCKKCGATLRSEDKFCPECGEKIGGVENTCRWCGFLTTKQICPECGKKLFPQKCKNVEKKLISIFVNFVERFYLKLWLNHLK